MPIAYAYDSTRSLTATQRRFLAHIQAADASGQTLKAYAAEHDLSVAALYNHKASLRKRGQFAGQAPAFARVALKPATGMAPLTVRLPNGVVPELSRARIAREGVLNAPLLGQYGASSSLSGLDV